MSIRSQSFHILFSLQWNLLLSIRSQSFHISLTAMKSTIVYQKSIISHKSHCNEILTKVWVSDNFFIIPSQTLNFDGGILESLCLSVCLSICPSLIRITCKPIQMKLYTVAVYNLRMYKKKDNPAPNLFKGDNYYN